jgi:hypothetical protein
MQNSLKKVVEPKDGHVQQLHKIMSCLQGKYEIEITKRKKLWSAFHKTIMDSSIFCLTIMRNTLYFEEGLARQPGSK